MVEQGDHVQAIADFDEAIKLDPKDAFRVSCYEGRNGSSKQGIRQGDCRLYRGLD